MSALTCVNRSDTYTSAVLSECRLDLLAGPRVIDSIRVPEMKILNLRNGVLEISDEDSRICLTESALTSLGLSEAALRAAIMC